MVAVNFTKDMADRIKAEAQAEGKTPTEYLESYFDFVNKLTYIEIGVDKETLNQFRDISVKYGWYSAEEHIVAYIHSVIDEPAVADYQAEATADIDNALIVENLSPETIETIRHNTKVLGYSTPSEYVANTIAQVMESIGKLEKKHTKSKRRH